MLGRDSSDELPEVEVEFSVLSLEEELLDELDESLLVDEDSVSEELSSLDDSDCSDSALFFSACSFNASSTDVLFESCELESSLLSELSSLLVVATSFDDELCRIT